MYWRGEDGKKYELSLGDVEEHDAEQCRLEIELALRTGEWPDWIVEHPVVARYRRAVSPASDLHPDDDVLDMYAGILRSEVGGGWYDTVMGHLRDLRSAAPDGDLLSVTSSVAREWLASRIRRGNARATRNRALTAASRFYKWAVASGYVDRSPMQDIGKVSEPQTDEIVYCTRGERGLILEAAGAWPAWLGVWIAFYAGLRRGEIGRLTWGDVDIERQRIRVASGKTGRPRVVPIAPALLERLERERPAGYGEQSCRQPVVSRGGCETWLGAARMMKEGVQRALGGDIPRERLAWNAWRHTFGSLLAQEGVSLDKISAWMGNGPGVCRRHYAAFVPRDRLDSDIERL